MELFKELLKIIDILTATYLIYYIISGLFTLKSKKEIIETSKKRKFAVLVPARNEELVIGNLLKSLKKQEYPKDMYDVFVIANNCTDKTKEISLKNDVNVIECQRKVKSKGEALRVAFDELRNQDYDGYIVFDADNIVHPKFIDKMNDALCEGYEVAQGFRDSKNPSDTWVSSSYSIHYLIHNVFLNKSRMNMRSSSFINGTGFMISKKLIEKYGYNSKTLTEDIELTVKCAINNEQIAFVEGAITYDEQVSTFKESWKQRMRWSIGTIQCYRLYFAKLMGKGIRKKKFSCIDSAIFLASPVIQLVGVVSYIAHFVLVLSQGQYFSNIKLLTILMWYIVSVLVAISAIKLSKKHIRPYIKGIITLPIFIISWMPINVIACFKKQGKWEKIEHTRSITIDKLLEKQI